MWNKKTKPEKPPKSPSGAADRGKLSREIAGLMAASAAVAIFFFGFLNVTASFIVTVWFESQGLYPTEMQEYTITIWTQGISFLGALTVFTVLFFFLLGQKLMYLRVIIKGIDALHAHRLDFTLPLEGNNEFTELAESINFLSDAERRLREKERQLSEDREALVRSLSHDIRTPLTSILSYSQYMQEQAVLPKDELDGYLQMMQKKAEQIKLLTDRLLDRGGRNPERIEQGKLLMVQLAEDWAASLEEDFICEVNYDACPDFSGEFDIGELQRIFDNLSSNVTKYADPTAPVSLAIYSEESAESPRSAETADSKSPAAGLETWNDSEKPLLIIEQRNEIRPVPGEVESNKIGLDSIRRITEGYDGKMQITSDENAFVIRIAIPFR